MMLFILMPAIELATLPFMLTESVDFAHRIIALAGDLFVCL
jgi:hypothetical protein